jgi:hypothetical protein
MNILFFHIPKTAGTFFANQLKHTLKLNLYRYFTQSKILEALNCNTMPENSLEALKNVRCIKTSQYEPCINADTIFDNDDIALYAHEFDESIQKFFNSDKWIKTTIVRDPTERLFSAYAQRQRNNDLNEFAHCVDLYQFYFVYHSLTRDEHKMELNDDTAPIILEQSIKIMKDKFNTIFHQTHLTQQFTRVFSHVNSLNVISERSCNITDDHEILTIDYSTAKKLCKFINYDYEFVRIFNESLLYA